nr:uncharacterized protein LOC109414985 isoform X1 [Aedes albopictus]XP_029728957.1 uncharacterized protein LOC109414985 isoform X1 [Aedes albopictus]
MMDSQDVSNSNNNIFYSSSLATSKRMQNGLSLLSITVQKRGSDFGQQPNDVNNQHQQASSSFLQQDQHQHYSQPHSHQQSSSFYYYNSRPETHDGVTLESVTVVGPWHEVIFPIAVLTVSLFGILAVGAVLLLWLKNNLKSQAKCKARTSKKLKEAKVNSKVLQKQVKMSEDEGSQVENINTTPTAKPESPRSKSLDVPQADNENFSSQILLPTSETSQQDPTVSTIYKNITSDNLSTISSPGNLKRAQAKTSLNNLSQISTSPSAVPSSPPLRSVHRKFSFNQSSFYEQQQSASKAEKYSANSSNNRANNDNLPYFAKLGSKGECLISKISVLKGDVCCVQPPQLHHATADLDGLTVASPTPLCSSPKMVYTQSSSSEAAMAISLTTKAQKLSDDKENLGKCSTAFESSRNGKAFRSQHAWIEGNENQTPSNRKVLTQSPIFFANEQNSPNFCNDSSSSPTLIPSLTPSSVSSSATSTATNTTPNANLNSASSNTGRFTFSPKVISEFGYQASPQSGSIHTGSGTETKTSNSYFRFPEVDTFTPPTSAQTAPQGAAGKPTTFKIPSLVTSWIPSLETPTKESVAEQELKEPAVTEKAEDRQGPEGSSAIVQPKIPSILMPHEDSLEDSPPSSTEDKIQQMVSSTRATRRARLKSISLDSDGARILEENFATSIPVEELVEIAANQSHHSVSGIQLQLPSLSQSHAQNDNDESNYASYRKQRNIFNLTLNLNDKDETLVGDDDYKFNEFYFEYYDYDDEEDEEYEMDCGTTGSGYSEKRKKQHSQLQTPKTPTLTQTRKKASSLDSDQSLSYLLPQPVRTQSAIDKTEHRVSTSRCAMNPSTATIRTSSLSVPTTPKRQPYRLPQQQTHGKYKQNRCMNDSQTSVNNSPASERHLLCGFQQKLGSFEENADIYQSCADGDTKSFGAKAPYVSNMCQQREQNLSVSNINLKTLPEITPVCDFAEKSNEQVMAEKPPIQTMNKSRSSILQRRGSNHSLTLNLDAAAGGSGLSKGLSASNYSLGNLKGSHLSLASSSYNLQQQQNQHQNVHQSSGAPNVHTKKNLLQRRGSNTSLILNLQGSNSSLNRYNSHSSLNIQNQQNVRPAKKCLLERRNSNTSLTLINIQNRALSVSNCNLPGSICSLNSMATYQTQNEALMLEEEENQMSASNNQSNCCTRATTVGAASESHLSPNCQQHGGRRKFLSSDSLHNITNSRAGCCCQQKETNMDAPHMCYHRGQISNYGGSIDDIKQQPLSKNTDCSCVENGDSKTNDKLSISTNDMFKFKSTVTSTASTNNLTQFTSCDCCCCNCADALAGGVNTMSISNTNVRKITTKPLSPQTTSEDFKIYLANIQFLQNASNMLSVAYMKKLHHIFKKSYSNYDKSQDDNVLTGANNDVKLTTLSIVSNVPADEPGKSNDQPSSVESMNDENLLLTDDEQKKMILKIHQEFWDLPTNYQEKPLVFGSQSKNRYKTILPNEHSRVILKAEPGAHVEPYINANFIKGSDYTNNSYIATQGPMANTIYEFWLMVQQNVEKTAPLRNGNYLHVEQKLIMLTDFVENNRQKCSVYFPQELNDSVAFCNTPNVNPQVVLDSRCSIIADMQNSIKTHQVKAIESSNDFNYFLITNIGICRKNGYTMRKLLVVYSYQDTAEKVQKRSFYTIYHYWFPDWPDHRSPEDIDVLLDMSLDILDNDCSKDFDFSPDGAGSDERICSLPIIHCSAGIGRTGCLLAIINGLSQMRSSSNANKITEKPVEQNSESSESEPAEAPNAVQQQCCSWISSGGHTCVDILGIVCNLRLQRGGMVQNSEQYELIHRALCLYMQKLSL